MSLAALKQRFAKFTKPMPMREFDNYDDYWRARDQVGQLVRRWVVAAEVIPRNASVLDVGSGSGEFVAYLAEQRPDLKIAASDFSPVAVQNAKDRGFEAFELDPETQDIPRHFDVITCFEVIEHLPEAERAMGRFREADPTMVVMSLPNVGFIDNRIRLAVFGRFPVTNCIFHVKEHVRHWTKRDFTDWVEHLGFRVTRVEGQDGGRFLPWKRYPALWSSGLIYILETKDDQ
jgi:SAM-dependent methyltransferase